MSNELIKLSCPQCDKRLKLPAQKKRRKIACPGCGHVFTLEAEWENAAQSLDEVDSDEFLNPAEVAAMQVDPEDLGERAVSNDCMPGSAASGNRIQVEEKTVGTAESANDVTTVASREKAQQWLDQRERTAELSLRRSRRVGYCLVLLALVAVLAQFFGYRFSFLDGMVFRISSGFGVFYFILSGIAGTFLVAYSRRNPSRKDYRLALVASLLLVSSGIGSFITARWVDEKHREELAARRANAEQPISQGTPVMIHRNQPGGQLTRKGPSIEKRPNARENTVRRGFGANGKPNSSVSMPLEPVQSGSKNPGETFHPQEQKTDFSVDQIIKETNEKPFDALNVAEFGLTAGLDTNGQGEDFDIPRADTVRDLVGYQAKRGAMEHRKTGLRPVLVDGGRVVDPSEFEGFQMTAIAGKQTKLGRIYFSRHQPCIGLDTLKSSTASQAPFKLILPIHGQPEFSGSLCHKRGFYLAGMKVNLQDREVVGVQAILAPANGNRLDMENLVTSAWSGQETGAQTFRVDAPLGKAVYGIVVYEEKLKVAGIGLVQKK